MKFRNYLWTASVYYRHYDSHLAGTLSDPRGKKNKNICGHMGSGLITSHSKHLLGNISAPMGPRKTTGEGYIKKVTVQSKSFWTG